MALHPCQLLHPRGLCHQENCSGSQPVEGAAQQDPKAVPRQAAWRGAARAVCRGSGPCAAPAGFHATSVRALAAFLPTGTLDMLGSQEQLPSPGFTLTLPTGFPSLLNLWLLGRNHQIHPHPKAPPLVITS